MRSVMKMIVVLPLVVGVVVVLGFAEWGCYKNCDPKTDNNCPCPPDVCGPLGKGVDAGTEGGK